MDSPSSSDVPMKPAGIDWPGDTPAHWGVKRLRFSARLNPKKSELCMDAETDVSFVPMDAVGEYGGMNLSDSRTLGDVYNGYTYFLDGGACIAKITPRFENGKGAIAEMLTNGVGFGTTELHIVRCSGELNAKFFFYATIAHNFRDVGASEMLGAGGQKRVLEGFTKDWMLPKPGYEVQCEIVRFLDEMTAKLHEIAAKVERSIDCLTEYRAALITVAVTGQIDERRLCGQERSAVEAAAD